MSGWDVGNISSVNLSLLQAQDVNEEDESYKLQDLSIIDAQHRFRHFFRVYQDDDNHSGSAAFIYRDQLKNNYNQGQFYAAVDLKHLYHHDADLHDLLLKRPAEYLPAFELAATEVARAALALDKDILTDQQNNNNDVHELFNYQRQTVQLQLINCPRRIAIRDLSSNHVSSMVSIAGIVVSAARPRIKPTLLHIMCRSCKTHKTIASSGGFGGVRLPRKCDSQPIPGSGQPVKCPLDPYIILSDSSQYMDQQRLKLQELNEDVPTGELPRHLSLACDRYLVAAVKPGSRIRVTGLYTTYESNAAADGANGATDVGIRIPYLRVYGIEAETDTDDFWNSSSALSASTSTIDGLSSSSISASLYNVDDEEEMLAISRLPDLYTRIANSMCPAIFDNEDIRNIKQALAVQLFGGSRKILADGMRLRGDINILLLGDPSVAKSQFLKFASSAAPIGVYTSGKGSSAAGLTASVVRDPGSGEFHLEGGALVLADGGLVAIDEFDKMREQDRVAIHEAMEQQTISIAKAGITTILNSRTSVLAAANPIFGRYDDMRSPTENIDFQTSILSRFDLIFIIRDVQNDTRDAALAKHVLNVHRHKDAAIEEMIQHGEAMIEIPVLKRYIAYAKRHCQPRLDNEAAAALKAQYVRFRQSLSHRHHQNGNTDTNNIIPITVRQLEAIVRISEALARMELSHVATTRHVNEALRLFQVSTFRAAVNGGKNQHSDATIPASVGSAQFDHAVRRAEADIRARLPAGNTMATAELIRHLMDIHHASKWVAEKAISNMAARNELAYLRMRRVVKRLS